MSLWFSRFGTWKLTYSSFKIKFCVQVLCSSFVFKFCVQVFTLLELLNWVCILQAPIPDILIAKRIVSHVFQLLELENWLVQVLELFFVFEYCFQVFTFLELFNWVCILQAPIPAILIAKRIVSFVFQLLELVNWLVQVLRSSLCSSIVFKYCVQVLCSSFGWCKLLFQLH